MGTHDLCQPPLEVRALDGIGRELDRAAVRASRLVGAAQASKEVGAGRVVQVVRVEPFDRVDDREPVRRVGRHRHRDAAVQRHDRRAGDALELGVERRDLRPVRLLLDVERGDRRLQLVDAGPRADATRGRGRGPPRRSWRGPSANGPGPRAGPVRRPRRRARRGASPAAASARAGRAPRARPASARRAACRGGSPPRTGRGARARRRRSRCSPR